MSGNQLATHHWYIYLYRDIFTEPIFRHTDEDFDLYHVSKY